MEVKRADSMAHDVCDEMSVIFTEGFSQWLTYFSRDMDVLSRTFSHMFRPEVFYTAVIDGQVAGIAACTDGKTPSVRLDRKEFTGNLGIVRGSFAYAVLKDQFEAHPYPFPIEGQTGSVEFVATASSFRGKGVATALISHIFENTPYKDYVLEVADTNTSAVNLYEKIGFRKFYMVKEKQSKSTGINYLVYMKYEKQED